MKQVNLNTYDIALILSNCFNVYIAKKFFSISSSEERNPTITRLLFVIYGLGITISSVLIDIPLINLITTIITISAIAFSYKIGINRGFVSGIIKRTESANKSIQ